MLSERRWERVGDSENQSIVTVGVLDKDGLYKKLSTSCSFKGPELPASTWWLTTICNCSIMGLDGGLF